MTGGLGNQMFIYAFYMKMKRLFPNTRIDLSDMMHYHVHNGYELHRIFQQLPEDEFCMPQKTKKVIEFLFFKTILERKQDLTTLRAFFKRRLWPLVYFKGFYQDERYFKDIEDEVRGAFAFNTALCNEKTLRMLRQIEADESWQDMLLMSRCRHHVICNSTFSWWGAWLNPCRDKIVMAPARWSALAEMPYICPKDWTLVPVKFDATQAPQ